MLVEMARRGRCLPSQLPWMGDVSRCPERAWVGCLMDHHARLIREADEATFVRGAKGGLTVTIPAPGV